MRKGPGLFGPTSFQGALAPLNLPDFRRLISSNFLWWGARFMEVIVVGWVVLELTDSAWQVAVIGFYRSAPFLVVGFVTGPIIDRFGRRKIILFSQAVNFLLSTLIALLLWTGYLAFWHLAVTALLMGAAWSIDWAARRSFMPDLVGKSKTVEAMLMENFFQNIARIVGPFAGGALIAVLGAPGAYAVLAGASGLSLLILLGLSNQPVPRRTRLGHLSAWANIAEGLRYVRQSPPILVVLLITVIMNLLVFPYVTLLPVFARDVLGQGPVGLGIMGAAPGVGAFLGLLVINRIRSNISEGWIFAAGSGFAAVVLVAFSFSGVYGLSLALLFLTGFGQASFGTMQSSIVLLAAGDEMRSRAMGMLVLSIGAGPLGQLQLGALAEGFGAPLAVGFHAALAVLAIIITAAAIPDFRRRLIEGEVAGPVVNQ